MMPDKQPPETPLVEPVPAPEIFAEGYACVGLGAGVAKFAFFSHASTSTKELPERRIVLRLTMPLGGLVGVHEAMGRLIQGLKEQGQIVDAADQQKH
jgi:hypothetical protein